MRNVIDRANDQEGHAGSGTATLIGAIGAVVLGIGAATDSGVTAVIGGIVLGLGVLGVGLITHITVDYDIFRRLERLEAKQEE